MTQREGNTPPTRLLIVDDDDLFRESLARMVRAEGFACVEATSGCEARALLDDDPAIAAMLCDIHMRDESGFDLLKKVVADFPLVAVIMVTGLSDPMTAQAAFDIGADGYLTKPLTRNDLLISLAGALTRRDLMADRQRQNAAIEVGLRRERVLSKTISVLEGDIRQIDADGETIQRLSRAVSLRDEETGRHIERMSRYSAILAERVGFDALSTDEVRLATALHDVGKIGVPDTILLKPGSLTGEEYVVMQRHSMIGFQLLAGSHSPLLAHGADCALCHHEWWNGDGYPRGLRGHEIPEIARIAAVADVFDALTSDRVYRPGAPIDEALGMMSDLGDKQFEPRLLDAFVGLMPEIQGIRETFPDRVDEQRIRVLLVDDHELFVEGITRLLSTAGDLTVVGTARSVAEGRRQAAAYDPDVILMDFELPDGDGVVATGHIKAFAPHVKVIMLTGRTDDGARVRALSAGCAGFVNKTEALNTLVDAIRTVHSDNAVGQMRELAPLIRQLPPTRRGVGSTLSRRQVEVLGLIAAGLSDKQIATELDVSSNTVDLHVRGVMHKFQTNSKLEAVATGVREGVIAFAP